MAYGDDPQHNPYAAPREDFAPITEVAPTTAYGYGGFWLRFVAQFIDNALLLLVVGIPVNVVQFLALGGLPEPGEPTAEPSPAALAAVLVSVLVAIAANIGYWAGMESSRYQATLGKMALGLKVVDLYGRRISFLHAVGRFLGKILSRATCYIGFFMAGFTQRKQALHDMIAGTLVVRVRP